MFQLPINEQGWGLFTTLISELRRSEFGSRAVALFIALIVLLLLVNGINILGSYVGRDFMSALADRQTDAFSRQALIYVMVFAALTLVSVILRYCEESLGLLWREFMTRRFLDLYLRHPTYYRLNDELIRQSGVEHPDQRIADDVKTFTTTTLSFILMVMSGVFTVVSFSSVLWMISPWLFAAALAYAAAGSYFTIRLGSPLVGLNYLQLDKEAAFRSGLIHVGDHAESIALLHHEGHHKPRLMRLFDSVADNFRKIIVINRNLGFFVTGYNWMIQIIPVLLVAPLYMQGTVEFGVVTQSAMAFAWLVGAFSLIITQFQSLSSYAAVIQRLVNLWYVIEMTQTETVSGLDVREEDDEIVLDHLTLISPRDKRVLVKDLSITIPHGTRTLISGNDDTAKEALLKAMVGIYDAGTGLVRRPPLDRILFLPERPYLPPGSLREALTTGFSEAPLTNERIEEVLELLQISPVVKRVGGLDVEHDWDSLLAPHEQRLISFARILLAAPRFAVMTRPVYELHRETAVRLLKLLADHDITLVTMGRQGEHEGDDQVRDYDAMLELNQHTPWRWQVFTSSSVEDGRVAGDPEPR